MNSIAVDEAREWMRDCGYQWSLDISDAEVVLLVDRAYDGGWEAFLKDVAPILVCER